MENQHWYIFTSPGNFRNELWGLNPITGFLVRPILDVQNIDADIDTYAVVLYDGLCTWSFSHPYLIRMVIYIAMFYKLKICYCM